MPVCAACGTENPEIAKFCLACGSPLAAAAPPEEERKPITAVFVDLVGSTSIGEELDPEDVLGLLEPYYERLRTELERFGGTVEKFIGDAIVALFGAPAAHEDDPLRAVRAGFAVLDAIRELDEDDESHDLRVRIGITTGEALVALGVRPEEGKGLAWGDVLNTAARLQSAAPVNGILVDETTYRATERTIEYQVHEPIAAKGKAEPVLVWQPVALRAEPLPRPAERAPLVGRDDELARLLELWGHVRSDGAPGRATIVGAPGIGKSRLLHEVATRTGEEGTVYWGRCLSYGEGITYWPVIQLVRAAAGVQTGDDGGLISLKLGALLERLEARESDELRTIAAALANLVGIPRTPRGTYSAEEISQAELHWGIRRLFELLALDRPLVLVLEDLHWAEPTLLDLLDQLGASAGPILLLTSARPELRDFRPGILHEGDRRVTLELDALGEAASEALLSELLAAHGLVAAAPLGTLLRNAGGNPLFLEETVLMLIDAGVLGAEGRRIDSDLEALPVPTSLQALIGSRLDALPADEKRLAQHASVAGPVFWTGAVAHLHDDDGGGLDRRLEGLERRDVVHTREPSTVVGEREWAFKHIVLRDVAYGRIPKGRRAGLHVRFAEWVAALPGGDDDFVEIVAYHLEQACRLAQEVSRTTVTPPVAQAVDALTRAGEKAERREGIREAERFYARALDLLPDSQAETALELRLRRGRALMALGELREARAQLDAVAAEAAAAERTDLRCAALITLANIDSKQGRAGDARPRLAEAAKLAAELGDLLLRVRAAFEWATVFAWFDADPEAASAELVSALALAEELDDRALRIEGHMRLGTVFSNRGDLGPAAEQYELARALASDSGSFRDEARATALLAAMPYYRGDVAEGERLALRALAWLERTGETVLQLQTRGRLARYAMARGDTALAEERLKEALPSALEFGGWLMIETYRYLVEALVREGRVDDARELVAFARRDAPPEDEYAQAALRIAEALVAADEARVQSCFDEAVTLLETARLAIDLAETRLLYGRTIRGFGREELAREQLELARIAFERAGAPNLVAEVDRELARAAETAP